MDKTFWIKNLSRNLLHPRPQFDLKLVNFTQNIDLYFKNFLSADLFEMLTRIFPSPKQIKHDCGWL